LARNAKFSPTVRLKIATPTAASNSARPRGMVGHLSVLVAATGPGKFARDSALNAFSKLSASANDNLTIGVGVIGFLFNVARNAMSPVAVRRMSEVRPTGFTGGPGSAHPNNGAGRVYSTLFINHFINNVLCAALMGGVRVLS